MQRQYSTIRNPREIVTITGHGVKLRVRRNQLEITDGFPLEARQETRKITRAAGRVRRLLLLAGSGFATLDALDWSAENGVPVVALSQSGESRWTLLPGRGGEGRAALRRAQALAPFTDAGAEVARWLIRRKIEGQRDVLRELAAPLAHLPKDAPPRWIIPKALTAVDTVLQKTNQQRTITELREIEAKAATAYYLAWNQLPLHFAPPSYARTVPDHWRKFAGRGSPLNNGNRNAADPANALLNYAYALVESEALVACHEAGLDPALAMLHTDIDSRRSFVYDVMEPVRPIADRLVLNLCFTHAFRPGELWALRDGRCLLDQDLCAKLWPWMTEFRRALGPVMTYLLGRLRRLPRYGERRAWRLIEVPPPRRTRAPLGQKRWARDMPPPPLREIRACQRCGVLLEGPPSNYPGVCDDCLPAFYRETIQAGLRSRRGPIPKALRSREIMPRS